MQVQGVVRVTHLTLLLHSTMNINDRYVELFIDSLILIVSLRGKHLPLNNLPKCEHIRNVIKETGSSLGGIMIK